MLWRTASSSWFCISLWPCRLHLGAAMRRCGPFAVLNCQYSIFSTELVLAGWGWR